MREPHGASTPPTDWNEIKKNKQSRDKRLLKKNGISFKVHICNSLYNALKEMFISGGYYKLILLSKDAHRTVHYRYRLFHSVAMSV